MDFAKVDMEKEGALVKSNDYNHLVNGERRPKSTICTISMAGKLSERSSYGRKSRSFDHSITKPSQSNEEILPNAEESRAKSVIFSHKEERDARFLQNSIQEKEDTIEDLKRQLEALKQECKVALPNKPVTLENENQVLREENQFLKQDLQRLSVHSTRNMELVGKINELEESLKDIRLQQPKEYLTITGMHEICEGFLWLGDRFAAADTPVLKKLGITYLLTLYGTHEHEYSEPLKALCIPLCDFGNTDLGSVLKRCFAFIEEAKAKKQKILVHCAAGINRSPSIVIAYLMKSNLWKYQQAFDFVQDKRWFINPAPLYRGQLQQYEEILFNRRDVEKLKNESKQSSSFSLSGILTFWFGSASVSRPLLF